jgi:hypothetical protein
MRGAGAVMALALLAAVTALPAGMAAALPPLPSPLPSLPLPTVPLPTVPLPTPPLPTVSASLPLPTVPLPTVPLPTVPLPTVLPSLPVPTVLPSSPGGAVEPTGLTTPLPSSRPDASTEAARSAAPSTLTPVGGTGPDEPSPSAFGAPAGASPPTSSPFDAFVLPGLLVGIPALVLLLIVGIQAAGGAAWVPVIRRWVRGGEGWPGGER